LARPAIAAALSHISRVSSAGKAPVNTTASPRSSSGQPAGEGATLAVPCGAPNTAGAVVITTST
jgi:hypothetical protein